MTDLDAAAAKLAREARGVDPATLRKWDEAGLMGSDDDPLADKYAERIREAMRHISDERVRVFNAFFSVAPSGCVGTTGARTRSGTGSAVAVGGSDPE